MNKEATTATEEHTVQAGELMIVPKDMLVFSKVQPRPISKTHVNALKAMISTNMDGVTHDAIRGRRLPDGKIEITAGHHRFVALDELEANVFPVRVFPMDDEKAYMDVITSNTGRPATMLDIGRHYLLMSANLKESGKEIMTQAEYGEAIGGKGQSYVSQCVKIANMYYDMRDDQKTAVDEAMSDSTLSSGHLLVLVTIKDEAQRSAVLNTVLQNDMSVTDTKKLVADAAKGSDEAGKAKTAGQETETEAESPAKSEKTESSAEPEAQAESPAKSEKAESDDGGVADADGLINYIVTELKDLAATMKQLKALDVPAEKYGSIRSAMAEMQAAIDA